MGRMTNLSKILQTKNWAQLITRPRVSSAKPSSSSHGDTSTGDPGPSTERQASGGVGHENQSSTDTGN